MMHFQTSAKTAHAVNEAFEQLSRVLMKKRDEDAEKNSSKPASTFGTSLSKPKKIEKKKKGFQDECCN